MVAIVMSRSARMPNSCRGTYYRVAVVDVEYWRYIQHGPRWEPKMISARAVGVLRVLRDYGPQSSGRTERCAYRRALAAAHDLADRYNNSRDAATAEQIIGAGGSA